MPHLSHTSRLARVRDSREYKYKYLRSVDCSVLFYIGNANIFKFSKYLEVLIDVNFHGNFLVLIDVNFQGKIKILIFKHIHNTCSRRTLSAIK